MGCIKGYIIINLISNTNNSKVYRVKKNKKVFIIKQVKDIISGIREYKLLSFIRNRYINKVHSYFISDGDFYIVLEPFGCGTLQQAIEQKDRINKRKIILQLIKALEYLHTKCITHCDIKPNNILIDRNSNIQIM